MRKYFKLNDNANITYQYLWDAAKIVLRGKFIALNTHIKKEKQSKNNFLRNKPKANRRKEITRRKTTKQKLENNREKSV